MLRFENVTKFYGGNVVLDNISIKFEQGKLYALVGPNGSGKTTMMKAAAGLVKPEKGVIYFNEAPINVQTKSHIAYMPTEPYYYNFMTIANVASYHKDFFPDFDMPYFKKLLDYMGLSEKLKIKSLSSGMAAKLKIAVTLSRRSNIVMLDEPLNGIDIIARDQIISSIIASASQGSCFIISSHLFDELEPIVNDIVMVRNGQIIINGNIDEVRRANNKSISDLYREVYGAPAFNPYGYPQPMPNMPYGQMPQQSNYPQYPQQNMNMPQYPQYPQQMPNMPYGQMPQQPNYSQYPQQNVNMPQHPQYPQQNAYTSQYSQNDALQSQSVISQPQSTNIEPSLQQNFAENNTENANSENNGGGLNA